MAELLNFNGSLAIFFTFLIILIRVSSVLIFAPIFSSSAIPPQVKIAICFVFSIVLYPIVKPYIHIADFTALNIGLIVIRELILAIGMAFCVQLVWAGIELGAQLVGFMMGFTIANVLSPQENIQISILSEFFSIFALLIFLAIDGHYIFIRALVDSFKMIPVGGFVFNQGIFEIFNRSMIMMFGVAFKVLAPAIIALLITNVVFGIIARVMPQINVIIVAFPLSIGIGLFVMGATLTYSAYTINSYYQNALSLVYAILGAK